MKPIHGVAKSQRTHDDGRQVDNVHGNNDENKDDADDDAGNEMIMMLRIG